MPNNFGTYDHLCPVSQDELLDCATLFATESYMLDNDYFQLCDSIMQEYGWIKPVGVQDMCDLYAALREVIQHLLLT